MQRLCGKVAEIFITVCLFTLYPPVIRFDLRALISTTISTEYYWGLVFSRIVQLIKLHFYEQRSGWKKSWRINIRCQFEIWSIHYIGTYLCMLQSNRLISVNSDVLWVAYGQWIVILVADEFWDLIVRVLFCLCCDKEAQILRRGRREAQSSVLRESESSDGLLYCSVDCRTEFISQRL